ncbi:MAG: SDR family NAD(P)-dependent oxidoreductase [bacterium]|nr:SDR family NAD(P)-dependent oxidoreductase [Myxococcales bacterium]
MKTPIEGVILVTGASSGIGEAAARLLAARADVLVLVARREDRLTALAGELGAAHPRCRVEVRPCDLTDGESARALVADVITLHGRIDVLVNNAGMGDIGPFARAEPGKLDAMLRVNVIGATAMARAVAPAMIARRRGGILNVSSGFGLTWMPMFAAYVGTKHYVTAFSEALRVELADQGVVVSQLCPGPVATEFEAVADNPFGVSMPKFMEIDATRCARAGIEGLANGRAIIIPGAVAWVAITLGRLTPRFVMRALTRVIVRAMRRRLPEERR